MYTRSWCRGETIQKHLLYQNCASKKKFVISFNFGMPHTSAPYYFSFGLGVCIFCGGRDWSLSVASVVRELLYDEFVVVSVYARYSVCHHAMDGVECFPTINEGQCCRVAVMFHLIYDWEPRFTDIGSLLSEAMILLGIRRRFTMATINMRLISQYISCAVRLPDLMTRVIFDMDHLV